MNELRARRLWVCTGCGSVCQQCGNREIDGWDLICEGCSQAYVIVDGDTAVPAGS